MRKTELILLLGTTALCAMEPDVTGSVANSVRQATKSVYTEEQEQQLAHPSCVRNAISFKYETWGCRDMALDVINSIIERLERNLIEPEQDECHHTNPHNRFNISRCLRVLRNQKTILTDEQSRIRHIALLRAEIEQDSVGDSFLEKGFLSENERKRVNAQIAFLSKIK